MACTKLVFSGVSRIMAGMLQKDSCPRRTGIWIIWEMACIFLRPLVSESHLFELLPEEYGVAYFRDMTPGMVSVFSTLLGSTADTCSASVYEPFLEEFHAFLREGRTFGS